MTQSGPVGVPFARQLLKHGLIAKETEGDGNCLFHAAAAQLTGEAGSPGHAEVRRCAVLYMRLNRQDFEESFSNTEESFDQHVERLAKDGEHGDQYEVRAISEHYARDVAVQQLGSTDLRTTLHYAGDGSAPPLQLAYTGDGVTGHYSTIAYVDESARSRWQSQATSGRAEARAKASGLQAPVAAAAAATPPTAGALAGSPTAASGPAPAAATSAVSAASAPAAPEGAPAAPAAAAGTAQGGAAPREFARCPKSAKARPPGVRHGMCAPTAISEGLRQHIRYLKLERAPTPEEVQTAITGSANPRHWGPSHFVAAARTYRVALCFSRNGRKSQTIGVNSAAASVHTPRIFLS
jgi:hypothetical protein